MFTKIKGLYSLCDTTFSPELSHFELAKKILEGGAPILQLRMKGEKDLSKVREVASSILSLKKKYDFTFVMNDYVDLAIELEVDAIHVGQDDLSIKDIKRRTHIPVGYSSHSLEEAKVAEEAGADYLALGAIFPTKTKGEGHPVCGVEYLKKYREEIKLPIVAIGGINRENLKDVLATGVNAVAMITEITEAPDITARVREINRVISNEREKSTL